MFSLFSIPGAHILLSNDYKTMRFVKLTRDDMEELLDMERACFSHPWTENQFALSLEQQAFHIFGFKEKRRINAYCAFYRVEDEMEILNIAVLPELRGKGVGERLLALVLDICRKMGVRNAFLEVRPSNTAARRLYEKLGFKPKATRKAYYPDNNEDAVIMQAVISS